MNPSWNDIPLEKREILVELLNARLADLLDLQLQAKQAHWNVKGPHFMSLHELFDRLAETIEEYVDTVAERIVILGGTADGTVATLVKRSTLAAYPVGITCGRDHVQAVSTALAAVAIAVRGDITRSANVGDAGTADLLTSVSRAIDKQLWFVQSHLQE